MALSQSLRNSAVVVEKFVTLATASGTVVGPAVPAGTIVLSAGIEVLSVVPTVTTFTVAASDGTTTFMAATSISNTAANTIRAGVTPGFIAAADTVDAVLVISGSPGAIPARIWAVVIDVNDCVLPAAEVDRDVLA
jgi:hypothetical protein